MKTVKTSISLTEDEIAIADATAHRLGISRSLVFRHLLLYHGLCGGDMPLTSRILNLPDAQREKITGEIRKRAESDSPATPQKFREWVKDVLGSGTRADTDAAADSLLARLLES